VILGTQNGWKPVAVIEGGVISFVRADHIGRPIYATNATGAKVWTATYQPFGGVHTSTGALTTARFPGQWFQSESGLHQNWMHDYDPTTGRYLQADPLGLVDGASVYGYVKQSPMRLTDHSGLSVAYPHSRYPGSTSDAYDAELCNVADEICRLMYEEDVPPKAEGGFPGKLCHYRCNSN
jgi:RHS repeat-associated protein